MSKVLWRKSNAVAVVAAILGTTLLAISPDPAQAEVADCGANDGKVCWENEACVKFWIYEHCTTSYKYYPSEGGGEDGGGDDGGGDGSEPPA